MIAFLIVLSQTAYYTMQFYDFAVHHENCFPDKDTRLQM